MIILSVPETYRKRIKIISAILVLFHDVSFFGKRKFFFGKSPKLKTRVPGRMLLFITLKVL